MNEHSTLLEQSVRKLSQIEAKNFHNEQHAMNRLYDELDETEMVASRIWLDELEVVTDS